MEKITNQDKNVNPYIVSNFSWLFKPIKVYMTQNFIYSELQRGPKCSKVRFFRAEKLDIFALQELPEAWPKGHMTCLCAISQHDSQQNMAQSKRKPVRKGGRYCVARSPNSECCTNTQYTQGISTHLFPSEPSVRAQWVKFVRQHRVDFNEPVGKFASVCSAHFEQG